jgi:hypothetical protein
MPAGVSGFISFHLMRSIKFHNSRSELFHICRKANISFAFHFCEGNRTGKGSEAPLCGVSDRETVRWTVSTFLQPSVSEGDKFPPAPPFILTTRGKLQETPYGQALLAMRRLCFGYGWVK